MQHFVAADTVCSETFGTDLFQQSALYVCLHCIVNFYVVLFSKDCNVFYGTAEQVHVVIIERSGNAFEPFYCIDIQHFRYVFYSSLYCAFQKRRKTIAKVAKKSVISQPEQTKQYS